MPYHLSEDGKSVIGPNGKPIKGGRHYDRASALRHLRALEINVKKGDVVGHEFHGNQYTVGQGGMTLYHVTTEENAKAIMKEGLDPGKVGTGANAYPNDVPGVFLGTGQQVEVIRQQMLDADPSIKPVVFEAYVAKGKTLYEDTSMPESSLVSMDPISPRNLRVIDMSDNVGRQRMLADARDFTTMKPMSKGDVVGHEFHGNQWTGGAADALSSDYVKNLAEADRAVVRRYTGGDFTWMNRALRTGNAPSEKIGAKIATLDRVIKDAPAATQTFSTDRFLSGTPDKLGMKVGETWTEKGFMSTSAHPIGDSNWKPEMVMHIEAPEGSKAIYVKDIGGHKSEEEVIFGSGSQFYVRDIKVNENGPETIGAKTSYDVYLTHIPKSGMAKAAATVVRGDTMAETDEAISAALAAAANLAKGDVAGHDFHGNQYVSVSGGTAEQQQRVKAAIARLPKSVNVSKLRFQIHDKGTTNKSLVAGRVVGERVGNVVHLYPGHDENTIFHEVGHTIENEHAAAYQRYLSDNGLKAKGGYGTEKSKINEALANSFSSYMRGWGGGKFWDARIGSPSAPMKKADIIIEELAKGDNMAVIDDAINVALAAAMAANLTKGDVAGHEFHGNQWTGGGIASGLPPKEKWSQATEKLAAEHEARMSRFHVDAEGNLTRTSGALQTTIAPSPYNKNLLEISHYRQFGNRAESLNLGPQKTYTTQYEAARIATIEHDNMLARLERQTPPKEQFLNAPEKYPIKKAEGQMSEELQKGDVAGHEFHGNQYTEGGISIDDIKKDIADGRNPDKIRAKYPEGAKVVIHPKGWFNGPTKEVTITGHSVNENGEPQIHYGNGKTAAATLIDHDQSERLNKGDVVGHEFHGNQWTAGGGGESSTYIKAANDNARLAGNRAADEKNNPKGSLIRQRRAEGEQAGHYRAANIMHHSDTKEAAIAQLDKEAAQARERQDKLNATPGTGSQAYTVGGHATALETVAQWLRQSSTGIKKADEVAIPNVSIAAEMSMRAETARALSKQIRALAKAQQASDGGATRLSAAYDTIATTFTRAADCFSGAAAHFQQNERSERGQNLAALGKVHANRAESDCNELGIMDRLQSEE